MIAIIVVLSLILCLTFYFRVDKPKKIFKIYSQPDKWYHLKFVIIFIHIWLSKLKRKLFKRILVENLEKVKPLSEHDESFDGTSFRGVSSDGMYFSCAVTRRHHGQANGFFYIAVPEFGLLESEKLPNILLQAEPSSVLLMREYSAEGISLKPIEPMKKWAVEFEGKMRVQTDPKRLVDVKLQGEWTSDLPYFLADDINTTSLAAAVARETWSRQFFQTLATKTQTHYEQMGSFKASLQIENKNYNLQMNALRDHSFGLQQDLVHRYVHHSLCLNDNTLISFGIVSQPSTTSHRLIGYIILPNKSLSCIKNCDFLLYQHGENGIPPSNYAFIFTTNENYYEVKIETTHKSDYFNYTQSFLKCEINGINGFGISEWHHNI